MKEVYRAKKGDRHTQVQYQLEEDEYGWLLYNMAHLLEEVKDTGVELTIAAKVLVDTKSDTSTLNLPTEPIEGMVSEKGVMLGHESVEYQFTVRISVPVFTGQVKEDSEPKA
jgi:hypothetical protein